MRLATEKRAPESVFLGARQTVGLWFDGSKRKVVEDVTWLSPDFLSRWLGFLSVREGWLDPEIQTRWMKLRARLLNELAFVVHVSALERVDAWESGIDTTPDSRSIQSLRYRFSYQPFGAGKPTVIEPAVQSEKELRSRKPELLASLPIFISTEWLEPLTPLAGSNLPYELEFPLGRSVTRYAVLTVPVPANLRESFTFQVNIFSATRTREAKFQLLGRSHI